MIPPLLLSLSFFQSAAAVEPRLLPPERALTFSLLPLVGASVRFNEGATAWASILVELGFQQFPDYAICGETEGPSYRCGGGTLLRGKTGVDLYPLAFQRGLYLGPRVAAHRISADWVSVDVAGSMLAGFRGVARSGFVGQLGGGVVCITGSSDFWGCHPAVELRGGWSWWRRSEAADGSQAEPP